MVGDARLAERLCLAHHLTPGPFLLAGLLAVGIAVFTVARHPMRAARTNPIRALRHE
jgi:putative ABC transport system permease protein